MFWKAIKRVRKGEHAWDEMVKDVNGQILREGVEGGLFFIFRSFKSILFFVV